MKNLTKITKEAKEMVKFVMDEANAIDDYDWGQDKFERDVRKRLAHIIETAYQQGIKAVKLKKISESEGWDLAKKFNCCPGDNMADAYNLAVDNLNKLKKKLK